MNKKILIGSIIAVVILVLVSFTGVVGYQTTSTTIAKASPLFSVRTSRAIGQELKDISTDYLGYGEETNIHLSSRMKRAEKVQKVISIISKMDDKAFSNLVAKIILHLRNQEQKETSDMLQILHNIRKNPNDMKYYDTKNNSIANINSGALSCNWFPGCIILDLISSIFIIIFLLTLGAYFWINVLLTNFCPVPTNNPLHCAS